MKTAKQLRKTTESVLKKNVSEFEKSKEFKELEKILLKQANKGLYSATLPMFTSVEKRDKINFYLEFKGYIITKTNGLSIIVSW